MPIFFASARAPQQAGAVFPQSAPPLSAPRWRHVHSFLCSTKLAVLAPTKKTRPLWSPRRPAPSLTRHQIPIGRAQPNSAISCPRFRPWEAFERRPRVDPTRRARAGVRNPSPSATFVSGQAQPCAETSRRLRRSQPYSHSPWRTPRQRGWESVEHCRNDFGKVDLAAHAMASRGNSARRKRPFLGQSR